MRALKEARDLRSRFGMEKGAWRIDDGNQMNDARTLSHLGWDPEPLTDIMADWESLMGPKAREYFEFDTNEAGHMSWTLRHAGFWDFNGDGEWQPDGRDQDGNRVGRPEPFLPYGLSDEDRVGPEELGVEGLRDDFSGFEMFEPLETDYIR